MSREEWQAFWDRIYNAPPNSPHCGHCGRPMFLVNADGRTRLYCKHCADLAAEEEQENNKKIRRY